MEKINLKKYIKNKYDIHFSKGCKEIMSIETLHRIEKCKGIKCVEYSCFGKYDIIEDEKDKYCGCFMATIAYKNSFDLVYVLDQKIRRRIELKNKLVRKIQKQYQNRIPIYIVNYIATPYAWTEDIRFKKWEGDEGIAVSNRWIWLGTYYQTPSKDILDVAKKLHMILHLDVIVEDFGLFEEHIVSTDRGTHEIQCVWKDSPFIQGKDGWHSEHQEQNYYVLPLD